MKKKMLTLLVAFCLFAAQSTTAFAADFPLAKSNSWSFNATGTSGTYTIPYTGTYSIVLTGSSGGCYGDTYGFPGYELRKNIVLKAGDTISYNCGTQPNCYTSGDDIVVPGGNYSTLYYNNTLVLRAGSGGARVANNIAPNGIVTVTAYNSNGEGNRVFHVHWHSGNNAGVAIQYTLTAPGGCYVAAGHTHNQVGCTPCGGTYVLKPGSIVEMGPNHYNFIYWCNICHHELYRWSESTEKIPLYPYIPEQQIPASCPICRNEVTNTYTLGCGFQQGEIVFKDASGVDNNQQVVGSNYYTTAWTPQYAEIQHYGAGTFHIELAEQYTLYYNNSIARIVYQNNQVPLVIKDKRVVYFQRP